MHLLAFARSRETRQLVSSFAVVTASSRVSNTKNLETLISFSQFLLLLHWHDAQQRSVVSSLEPQFYSLSCRASPGHLSHEVGSEGDVMSKEVVEQGVRLGVLLVFPSQLLTSYLLRRNTG